MIRRLPKDVVDRIAAGEVIDRPSAVVKELIENALDAGAQLVEVEIEKGGKRLIRVADDGCGMDPADLELAFVPHATSKLSEVDDLLAIASYGFRGEALASIGAVSRARIQSRTRSAEGGCEITCEGGVAGTPRPCAGAVGTIIEARNLFFNVPARARFLKADAAEGARCLEVALRFALVADGVAVRFRSEGRSVLEVPAGASRRDRFAIAFGPELATDLIAAKGRRGEIHVEALLAPPGAAKSTARHQLLYLNDRVVRDATLLSAVRQAYREFLAPALQPVFALFVTIDPADVDVNVHPAKVEVRFRDNSEVFRAVYHTVLDALRAGDLAPRPTVLPGRQGRFAGFVAEPRPAPLPPDPGETPGSRDEEAFPAEPDLHAESPDSPAALERPPAAPQPGPAATVPLFPRNAPPAFTPTVPPRTGPGVLHAFATYLLYEADGELVVVDQHALHERVLYERLRRELMGGRIRVQRLLVPAVLEVGRVQVAAAAALEEEFARVGLEVAPFGDTAIAVHAIPQLLTRGSPEDLVHAVLAADHEADARPRATLEERLHTLACRAAVKAGDVLKAGEVEALLDEASTLPEAKACPHGRPTVVRLGRGDLERWFKRSGF